MPDKHPASSVNGPCYSYQIITRNWQPAQELNGAEPRGLERKGGQGEKRREESVGESDRKKKVGTQRRTYNPPPDLLLYRLWNRG